MVDNPGIQFTINERSPKATAGWLESHLPKIVMERLQNYIKTAKKNPISVNDTLAGNISKSLFLEDKDGWFFQNVLVPLTSKYMEVYPGHEKELEVLTENTPFCIDTFWVNFMKKHDFNPPHDHTGVFSFVVFVKIPTDWREQHLLSFSADSNDPKASNFEFSFSSMTGRHASYSYLLDKKSEGIMLFFPAKLMHTVYPFYECDEERISISGNIRFNVKYHKWG